MGNFAASNHGGQFVLPFWALRMFRVARSLYSAVYGAPECIHFDAATVGRSECLENWIGRGCDLVPIEPTPTPRSDCTPLLLIEACRTGDPLQPWSASRPRIGWKVRGETPEQAHFEGAGGALDPRCKPRVRCQLFSEGLRSLVNGCDPYAPPLRVSAPPLVAGRFAGTAARHRRPSREFWYTLLVVGGSMEAYNRRTVVVPARSLRASFRQLKPTSSRNRAISLRSRSSRRGRPTCRRLMPTPRAFACTRRVPQIGGSVDFGVFATL